MSGTDHMDIDTTFGKNVRAIRTAKKINMTELAQKVAELGNLKFYPSTMQRIEEGVRPARLTEALTIANVLNVPLEQLTETNAPESVELTRIFDLYFEAKKQFGEYGEAAERLNKIAAPLRLAVTNAEKYRSESRGVTYSRLSLRDDIRDYFPLSDWRLLKSIIGVGDIPAYLVKPDGYAAVMFYPTETYALGNELPAYLWDNSKFETQIVGDDVIVSEFEEPADATKIGE